MDDKEWHPSIVEGIQDGQVAFKTEYGKVCPNFYIYTRIIKGLEIYPAPGAEWGDMAMIRLTTIYLALRTL